MSTRKKTPTANPNPFGVYAGPSAEEIARRDQERAEKGILATPGVEMGRDAEDKRMFDKRLEAMDPMLGGDPLKEAWDRYGTPGMSPKFLSDRCASVLGMRGYETVKDEHGDPVRVGTLTLGQIPERTAQARQRHYAEQSEKLVSDIQDEYTNNMERLEREARGLGMTMLRADETVRANATENEGMIGNARLAQFRAERQQ